jgi:hypothetical protein
MITSSSPAPGVRVEPPGVREIDSVEELRALADPVRLAILSALDTHGPDGELPVMSVKELVGTSANPRPSFTGM